MVVPYVKGLSESFKIFCNKLEIQAHFKGGSTIKNLLDVPNYIDTITQTSRVIYSLKCHIVECDQEDIGKPVRTFDERLKEHLRIPCTIDEHANTAEHLPSVDNFSMEMMNPC